MGYNERTVSLSLISKMMVISSYRRKIRSLYLFLFTFLTCLVHCKELPPQTGVEAKPLLSLVPKVFSRVRLDAWVSVAVYHERVTVVFFWPKEETAHEKSLPPRVSHFFLAKHKSYKVVSANIVRKVSMSIMSLFFGGYQFKNSLKNIIWKTFPAQYFPDVINNIIIFLHAREMWKTSTSCLFIRGLSLYMCFHFLITSPKSSIPLNNTGHFLSLIYDARKAQKGPSRTDLLQMTL